MISNSNSNSNLVHAIVKEILVKMVIIPLPRSGLTEVACILLSVKELPQDWQEIRHWFIGICGTAMCAYVQ